MIARRAACEVERRAGTDERPLIRLAGVDDPPRAARRAAAGGGRARRGRVARVGPRSAARFPALGTVARVLDAPSCSVLELEDGTLVPFISDAIERVDIEAREIQVERRTSWDEDRRLHAVPALVRLVQRAAPRANALALGHELDFVDLRATTPLRAGQVDDTPYGGGAGMVIRVDVVEAALRGALRRGAAAAPR